MQRGGSKGGKLRWKPMNLTQEAFLQRGRCGVIILFSSSLEHPTGGKRLQLRLCYTEPLKRSIAVHAPARVSLFAEYCVV